MSEFRFGHPDHYEVGSIFESRKALSDAGIHGPQMDGLNWKGVLVDNLG